MNAILNCVGLGHDPLEPYASAGSPAVLSIEIWPPGPPPSPSPSPPSSNDVRQQPPDCAICESIMRKPAMGGGCSHHFCYDCLTAWADQKSKCPTCHAPIWCVSVDAEFAALTGASMTTCTKAIDKSTEADSEAMQRKNLTTAHVISPAGLAIANNPDGSGCVIMKVSRGNGGHEAGLRVGDVLVSVNGAEVHDHGVACISDIKRSRCTKPVMPSRRHSFLDGNPYYECAMLCPRTADGCQLYRSTMQRW